MIGKPSSRPTKNEFQETQIAAIGKAINAQQLSHQFAACLEQPLAPRHLPLALRA
jgi:hypothetical protein